MQKVIRHYSDEEGGKVIILVSQMISSTSKSQAEMGQLFSIPRSLDVQQFVDKVETIAKLKRDIMP